MIKYKQLFNTIPIEFGKQFISFITGEHNDQRISLKYHFDEKGGQVYAEVLFGRLAQGPPGHAHGGAISAVFDELMGACCWVNGYPAMTAQYTTRFFKPVPLNEDVLYCAEIKEIDGNKISLKAQLINYTGEQFATAKGLFILQDIEKFKEMNLETGANVTYPHLTQ
ncbi:MAG: PaaI family thioesterase [Candidatus Marinimicrobia bacterium]|mgnify:FL=1|nr:PaaI family thioesterase [Candidatus Neomarinimicrobiota bacterium]MBT3630068.1 PaaI family thioesterase [Candidatus Neomarinimicrobiota bacterium]MBT3824235.1 PaaI family thioesterase [Candidatus Neomarinimicrobiota bacterium]MBT4131687.1 PaaI family thioesterase [Candidatus Neomarinimicrobiota bacterium]MBT4295483.1 PaaI family thioesterase [Candidatus Neomarinimicrobiota bacterium]